MLSLVILKIWKWNRKQKLLKIVGFFLDFFSWLILTTRSQNAASRHLLWMGPYFSKMVVEIAFLDLWTSLMSQIVTHSSDNETVFGENLNPTLSSLKSVIFLPFSQKMAFFGHLMHGMSHWNIFPISPSNFSCNRTYLTT